MDNQRISLDRHLTNIDYGHIINLITDDIYKKHIAPSRLHLLYLLAATSTKHESSNIPEDVITLNSEIILVSEKTQRQLVKIVLPKDVNGKNDISVYNPMAIAILGKKEKDFVFIKNNKTYLKIQIEKLVFQPEKEKASHL